MGDPWGEGHLTIHDIPWGTDGSIEHGRLDDLLSGTFQGGLISSLIDVDALR